MTNAKTEHTPSSATMNVARVEDGVVSLRVATDESPYIGPHTVEALRAAVQEIAALAEARVVLVEGGARHFSAGASRESLVDGAARESIPFYAADLPRLLLQIPLPTIAVMAGHALGGGLVLGLWCDAVVLAEESLYGANFMALGFTPGMGATIALEEALGAPLARTLLFSGQLIKGRALSGSALGHAVVPRALARDRALALAREMAIAPRISLELLKRTLAARRLAALETAVAEERVMHEIMFSRAETRALIAHRHGAGGAGGG
jgi:enoyl-CoA hydratase/carnithine racemase